MLIIIVIIRIFIYFERNGKIANKKISAVDHN